MSNRLPRRTIVRVSAALRARSSAVVVRPQPSPLALDGLLRDLPTAVATADPTRRFPIPESGDVELDDLTGKIWMVLEGVERGPFLLDLDRPGLSVFEFPEDDEFSLAGPSRSGRARIDSQRLVLRTRGPVRTRTIGERLSRLARTTRRPLIRSVDAMPLPATGQQGSGSGQTGLFVIELAADAPANVRQRLTRRLGLRLRNEEYLSTRLIPTGALSAQTQTLALGRALTVALNDVEDADRIAAVGRRLGATAIQQAAHDPRILRLLQDSGDVRLLRATETLQRLPQVRWVQPDLLRHVTLHAEKLHWLEHLGQAQAPDAWQALQDAGRAQDTVTVAVLDPSGIDSSQEDLDHTALDGTQKIVKAWDFGSGPTAGRELRPSMVIAGGHGDRCATSAVGRKGNGPKSTVGVAPGARLIAVRIPEVLTDSELADILLWTAGLTKPTGPMGAPPSPPADVLSCSFGVSAPAGSFAIDDALTQIAAAGRGGRGAVVVFSTGNSGAVVFDDPTSPGWRAQAAHPHTISVGACVRQDLAVVAAAAPPPVPYRVVGSLHPPASGWPLNPPPADPPAFRSWALELYPDDPAPYSQPGQSLDLVAPSQVVELELRSDRQRMVRTTTGHNAYGEAFGGTSHATAMVAGAAALVLAADPTLTAPEVRDILRTTARSHQLAEPRFAWSTDPVTGEEHSPYLGFGILDVHTAVMKALDPNHQPARARFLVRDHGRDDGTEPSTGPVAASPDLFVAHGDPAAATGEHMPPVPGIDNHAHVQVRNIGDAAGAEEVQLWLLDGPVVEPRWPEDASGAAVNLGNLAFSVAAGAQAQGSRPIPASAVPSGFRRVGRAEVVWQPTLFAVLAPAAIHAPQGTVRDAASLAQRAEAWIDAGGEAAGLILGSLAPTTVTELVLRPSPAARRLRWLLRYRNKTANAALLAASRTMGPNVQRVVDPVLGDAIRIDFPPGLRTGLRIPVSRPAGSRWVALVRVLDEPSTEPAVLTVTHQHSDGRIRGGYRLVVQPGEDPTPTEEGRTAILIEDVDDTKDVIVDGPNPTCPPRWGAGTEGSIEPWMEGFSTSPSPAPETGATCADPSAEAPSAPAPVAEPEAAGGAEPAGE